MRLVSIEERIKRDEEILENVLQDPEKARYKYERAQMVRLKKKLSNLMTSIMDHKITYRRISLGISEAIELANTSLQQNLSRSLGPIDQSFATEEYDAYSTKFTKVLYSITNHLERILVEVNELNITNRSLCKKLLLVWDLTAVSLSRLSSDSIVE